MIDPKFYDADYYERGIETGKSFYQNYRWIPELTLPMAMTLIDFLGITRSDKVLDYGCAKGFLVKALRLLHRQAWGLDVSEYALAETPSDTKQFCRLVGDRSNDFPKHFDWCIAKDVFEHIDHDAIDDIVAHIPASKMFVLVPLGDGEEYFAEANNMDESHVICEGVQWWIDCFYRNGWACQRWDYHIPGIKDSYRDNPGSHGCFVLTRMK